VAITARRLQREVERRERQLGAAQALAHVGSYELDLRTGAVYWSDELWRMVGLAPGDGEMTADRSLTYVHPDDRQRIAEAIDLGRRYAGAFETTYRILRADGAIRHVAITGESDRRLVRAAVRDMTAEHEAEQRLRHAADHDHLTSLPNRRRFEREVEAALARGEELAVAVLDLDHFKFVNDSFGHVTGDALLCEVVHTLSSALEGRHVLARFGGDEFAVLLRSQDRDESLAAVERLLQALRDSCCTTTARSVTASAGLVVATDGADPQDLLKAADIALYEAKGAGRDRCALYRGPKGGLAWVEEVRAAIEAERLVLYSQPIVSLGSNEPREELLVRMLGTDGELLPPAAFIPTAEQFGLIADLDCWVVERALGLAAAGRRIEVNISGATLGDERIPELVEQAASRGVDPSLLTFELTETAAVRDLEGASAFAQRIVELGCQVALDDFGTGYGSLIYLRHLPISQIKIDQEFVRSMIDDPGSRRIVAAIAGMAQTMGHETVAEGVEDLGALELLRALGVDYAQGFAIARPAPVAQLVPS
jgi:diguanylate cyclase (GGDEF)-like protein/PAS domain S-box-containing protein